MPSPSALPLRQQILDRFVTVLGTITAGANYWFTPKKVQLGFLMPQDIHGYPCYMVMAAEKGGPIAYSGIPDHHDEEFSVSIKGVIKCAKQSDAVIMLEKARRDVRKAINDDSISGDASSLFQLASRVWITEGPDMSDVYLFNGFGFFDQKFSVMLNGTFSEL